MLERRQAQIRALPPLAVLGFGGAWLACDFFRVGAYDTATVSRGALVALGTVCAAIAGFVATLPRKRVGAVLAGAATTAALGTLVEVLAEATTATRAIVERPLATSARDGFVASLPFIVPIVLVALAARRTWARPGSLVGAADARGVWRVPAVALAIGAPLAALGCSSSRQFAIPLDVTLAIGGLSTAWLVTSLGLDLFDFAQGRHWAAMVDAMEPGEGTTEGNHPVVDFGIGDGEVLRIERADAYRASPVILGAVRGDAFDGMTLLRRALSRSVIAALVAGATLVFAFGAAKQAPRVVSERMDAGAARELDRVLDGHDLFRAPNHLPLVCQTYFTMAGGCVERLPAMETMHEKQRLDQVREKWVTGSKPPDGRTLESSCLVGLEELTKQPVCTRENVEEAPTRASSGW